MAGRPEHYFYESQSLTRTAPSGTPGSASQFGSVSGSDDAPGFIGMNMRDVQGILVTITAPAAATLTSGTLRCYAYHPDSELWSRVSDLDLTVNSTTRQQAWGAMSAPFQAPGWRILWATDSIVLGGAGGSAVDVRVDGQTERRAAR